MVTHSLKKKEKNSYNGNARKSYLTLKEQYRDKANETFKDTNI